MHNRKPLGTVMKTLLFDCSGTTGSELVPFFPDYEVVLVNAKPNKINDFVSAHNLNSLFMHIGTVDNIIFIPSKNGELDQKLLGQVNIAVIGKHFLNGNGCITLTSGPSHCDEPYGQAQPENINAAIEGFVRSCALKLDCGRRINAVWPDTHDHTLGKDISTLAKLYRTSIERGQNGQVYAPDGDETGVLH